jgi:drug/metabolite transporter (DMT)-like permease
MSVKLAGILLLIGAMGLESFAQLALKVGAMGGPRAVPPPLGRLAACGPLVSSAIAWIGCGVLLYVVEIVLYTLALQRLDLSVAFPLGSLCFVGVAVLSWALLGEQVGRVRWLGVGCILLGTVVTSL